MTDVREVNYTLRLLIISTIVYATIERSTPTRAYIIVRLACFTFSSLPTEVMKRIPPYEITRIAKSPMYLMVSLMIMAIGVVAAGALSKGNHIVSGCGKVSAAYARDNEERRSKRNADFFQKRLIQDFQGDFQKYIRTKIFTRKPRTVVRRTHVR